MTQQRDIGLLLDAWLGEGSSVAPDRVIDVVADRIERQSQRGAWRFPAREFHMPAILRLVAVPAVLALAVAGAIYLGGAPGPNVAPPTPGPNPTALASVQPSPSPYLLPSGKPYQSPGVVTWTDFKPNFRIDAPLGWSTRGGSTGFDMDLGLIHDDVAGDSGSIAGGILIRPNPVLGTIDSCLGSPPAAPTVGQPTAATEIVASILADPRFAALAGPTVLIDGRTAQVLDVGLAPTFTGTCTSISPSALLFDEPGSFVVLEGDVRYHLVLLDVDGVPLLILVSPTEEAYDAFVTRAMGLIDGMTFLP